MIEAPDEVAVLYYRDGSTGYIEPVHFDEVDAALALYAGDGPSRFTDSEQRDSVLRLRSLSGARITVLASALYGVSISTRASRQLKALQDAAIEADGALPGPVITEVANPDAALTESG